MWLTACLIGGTLIGIATAQQAPVSSSVMDFTGGLNTQTESIYLKANESPRLMNVVIDAHPGRLSQRSGYYHCGHSPSGNPLINIFPYTKQDGSRNIIVADNAGTVWQTPDCIDFTQIVTGLSAAGYPRFAIIYDRLWIVNGVDSPVTWDGGSAYILDGNGGRPNAPPAKYISFWKGRVFLANTVTDPSGVYFSTLANSSSTILNPATDVEAWSNINNLIYFSRDDGSPIYGIKLFRDNLYVFKELVIHRLVFENDASLSVGKTVSATGSKSQDAIVEMDDSTLRFVGRDGLYTFDGNKAERISARWTPTFYTINRDATFPLTGVNYQSRYWLAASTTTGATSNDFLMVESQSPLHTFAPSNIRLNAAMVMDKVLYGVIGSRICVMDSGDTDDGATITSYWESRDEIYTSPVQYKTVGRVVVDYERLPDNPTLQIGLSNDLGVTFSTRTLDTGEFLLPRNTKIANLPINNTLQFRTRILNNTAGVGFNLLGIHTFGSTSLFTGN